MEYSILRAARKKTWYTITEGKLQRSLRLLALPGRFWFPPPSDSLSSQGYLPRRPYLFDTAYGTEGQLRDVIQAISPVQAMADIDLNHRVGLATAGADFGGSNVS